MRLLVNENAKFCLQIKPIICLSGTTIFTGGLLSQPSMVDMRIEVVITGESEQKVTDKFIMSIHLHQLFLKAIELFARQIIRDIKSTATITEHNYHLLIGNKVSLHDCHQ